MRVLKQSLILLLLWNSAVAVYSQTAIQKVALIIAIGKYQPGSGWANLLSERDDSIITATLLKKGFTKFFRVTNEMATVQGIKDGFRQLTEYVNKGDIVYIHISAHGQQLWDGDGIINGDEADHLDECIVSYNAPSQYYVGYKGEKHLRDDDLNLLLRKVRKSLGPNGEVLVANDACFSGNSLRGDTVTLRGNKSAMIPENYVPQSNQTKLLGSLDLLDSVKNLAPVVMISASQSDEPNCEYGKICGSLTYSMSKALEKLPDEGNYLQLFGLVQQEMSQIRIKQPSFVQKPQLEGSVYRRVFNGTPVQQLPFFEVFVESQSIKGGSKINGIRKGMRVGFMQPGAPSFIAEESISTALVTEVNAKSFSVDNQTILAPFYRKLWMFILDSEFSGVDPVSVNISAGINKRRKKLLKKCLSANLPVRFISADANLQIEFKRNQYWLWQNQSLLFSPVDEMSSVNGQIAQYIRIRELLSTVNKTPSDKLRIGMQPATRIGGNDDYPDFNKGNICWSCDSAVLHTNEYLLFNCIHSFPTEHVYIYAFLVGANGNIHFLAPDYENSIFENHQDRFKQYSYPINLKNMDPGNYSGRCILSQTEIDFRYLFFNNENLNLDESTSETIVHANLNKEFATRVNDIIKTELPGIYSFKIQIKP